MSAADASLSTERLAIVGGAGHVGLPLALSFADRGFSVCLQDRNGAALDDILSGRMPFQEEGAEPLLRSALDQERLSAATDPEAIADADVVLVAIGTPVDEFLNPELDVIRSWANAVQDVIRDDQLIVLRSTLYPGTTDWLAKEFANAGRHPQIAFCPERIAQGKAITELTTLPQLVSGTTPEAEERAAKLFLTLAPEVIRLTPMEAEFAKLMTNAYRYISFAIANQFYQLADRAGMDFTRILHGCRHNYPRMAGFPGPGFTAGPCLFKDTMQLAAFSNQQFGLGHSAMLVNEGLPRYLVDRLKRTRSIADATVGILGMAFKAEIDDTRASLSYKLKKILELECRTVLCSDPYVQDESLVSTEEILERCEIVFIGSPHRPYRDMLIPSSIHVVDVWDCVADPNGNTNRETKS